MESDGRHKHRPFSDKGQNRTNLDDRPRILMSKHTKSGDKENRVVTPTSPTNQIPSGSPLPVEREEDDGSQVDSAAVAVPQPRPPPKKIMMRNLSDRSTDDGSDHASPKEAKDLSIESHTGTGMERSIKSLSSSASLSSPAATETSEGEPGRPKKAWDIEARGPITSQKTLYEPEGKKSEAKFHSYHRMTTEPRGGKIHRVSSSGSSAKGDHTPENTSAGILGEAPEYMEKVQLHGGTQQRRSHPDSPSPTVQHRQQQTKNRREPDSGRSRRIDHDRGEHSRGPTDRGRRKDTRDGIVEEQRGPQHAQKPDSVAVVKGEAEWSGGGSNRGGGGGRRRGKGRRTDTETRQRHQVPEKREGQKERDATTAQEPQAAKTEIDRPRESREGRRSRPSSQSHLERERGWDSEKHDHDRPRQHERDRTKDRNRDRGQAMDSEWSNERNRGNSCQETDSSRVKTEDVTTGQAAEKPSNKNRDRTDRTRDRDSNSFRHQDGGGERYNSDREKNHRRRRLPTQEDQKRQEDVRSSRRQFQPTDAPQSSAYQGSSADSDRRVRRDDLSSAKPSTESSKDLPNRGVQNQPTLQDSDKKGRVEGGKNFPLPSADQDKDKYRERDRRKERQRPRDGGRGEERRGSGQPHTSHQQEHQVQDKKPTSRQGQRRDDGEQGARRQATRERRNERERPREMHGETGESAITSARQQPLMAGVGKPERPSGRGRGRGGPRQGTTNPPRDPSFLPFDLEEIESPEEWDNDEDGRATSERSDGIRKEDSLTGEPGRRSRRDEQQRPGSGVDERGWRRGNRGRGRGHPVSERQDQTQPGSNRRKDQRYDNRRESSRSNALQGANVGEMKGSYRNPSSVQEVKKPEDPPHKVQDLSRFDVNSQGVVVVDEEGIEEEQLVQSPVGSSENDGFQLVVSKRDKQKDKEEKKRMEEKERKRDRDHRTQHGNTSLPGGSASQHGSHVSLGNPTSEQSSSASWSITEHNKPLWPESDWTSRSELPMGLPNQPYFGAVGDKVTKDQSYKPSSAPQPSPSNKDDSYQLFSQSAFPLRPSGSRSGDMLMAAVDQSVRLPFSASPQVPKESPPFLSEIIESETGQGDTVDQGTHDGRTQNLPQQQTTASTQTGHSQHRSKRKVSLVMLL